MTYVVQTVDNGRFFTIEVELDPCEPTSMHTIYQKSRDLEYIPDKADLVGDVVLPNCGRIVPVCRGISSMGKVRDELESVSYATLVMPGDVIRVYMTVELERQLAVEIVRPDYTSLHTVQLDLDGRDYTRTEIAEVVADSVALAGGMRVYDDDCDPVLGAAVSLTYEPLCEQPPWSARFISFIVAFIFIAFYFIIVE